MLGSRRPFLENIWPRGTVTREKHEGRVRVSIFHPATMKRADRWISPASHPLRNRSGETRNFSTRTASARHDAEERGNHKRDRRRSKIRRGGTVRYATTHGRSRSAPINKRRGGRRAIKRDIRRLMRLRRDEHFSSATASAWRGVAWHRATEERHRVVRRGRKKREGGLGHA